MYAPYSACCGNLYAYLNSNFHILLGFTAYFRENCGLDCPSIAHHIVPALVGGATVKVAQ